MADIPDTGNTVRDIQDAVYDYYETYKHSTSPSRIKHNAKNGTLSSSFIMFEPRFSGTITRWMRSGKKKDTRIREGEYGGIYERLRDKPDWFVLTVGILDDSETHHNVFGESDISYGLLFDCLKAIGYDPLWPIRKDEFIAKVERRMGNELLKAFSRKDYTTQKGRAIVESIGRETVAFVKDFIAAGKKPPLARETVRNREWKDGQFPGLYPNGIEEPLSETGQLENAISYDVEVYQSMGSSDYWKKKNEIRRKFEERRKEKRRKARESAKKMRLEKIAIKAVKNNIQSPESVITEKAAEIQRLVDLVADRETRAAYLSKALKRGIVDEDDIIGVRQSLTLFNSEVKKYTAIANEMSKNFGIPIDWGE